MDDLWECVYCGVMNKQEDVDCWGCGGPRFYDCRILDGDRVVDRNPYFGSGGAASSLEDAYFGSGGVSVQVTGQYEQWTGQTGYKTLGGSKIIKVGQFYKALRRWLK